MRRQVGPLLAAIATAVVVGLPALALAQPADAAAQSIHAAHGATNIQANPVLNGIEIVTGIAASLMALQAALAYRARLLGKGMLWVTIGMMVMAVGHIILVLQRVASFDVLGFLGHTGSFIGFSLAVFISFAASAYGFWVIRGQARHYASLEAGRTRTSRTLGQTPPR